MAASNRAQRITKLVATLKKRFKPHAPAQRPLFETLLYACLLENSSHEAAEKAIEQLENNYFDWNEVRVSTRAELTEVLKPLNDPAEAADRLKRTLQSVFESVYAFDLEAKKKQNLGQSVKEITAYDGVTPFAVSYVTQNGLGGHAIACNEGLMLAFLVLDLISEAEHKKRAVPGLERAIPKNKGVEAGVLLHLVGIEVGKNPYGTAARKLLTDLDPACKSRLPKRPPKAPKPAPKAATAPKAPKKQAAAEAKTTAKKPEAKKPSAAKPAAKKAPAKKAPTKKAAGKKAASAKKATAQKGAAKKKTAKKAPKKTVKKAAKKKPVKKIAKKTPKKGAKAKRKPR